MSFDKAKAELNKIGYLRIDTPKDVDFAQESAN